MTVPRVMLAGLLLGLATWAVVLGMELNRATNLSTLRTPATGQAAPATRVLSGPTLYAANCASCHQNRGEGRFPVFPPLANSSRVNGDPHPLMAITLHGLSGPIEANGVRYSGLMPGLPHLTDDEIAAVLNHVRSSWGNNAAPLGAADVAAVRGLTAARRTPWTAAELDALGAAEPLP